MVQLEFSIYDKIDAFLHKKILITEIDQEAYRNLVDLGFIVDANFDEKKDYLDRLKKDWQKYDFFCLHILPTTNCNFDCSYCYQSGIERNHALNTSDCNKIIIFLDKYLSERKEITNAHVVLHGGEPTLNWKFVEYFLPLIDSLFRKHKINYHTQIVTNGYLLTNEKSKLLFQYNWNRAQITLDGLPEIHNKRRNLKNNLGTFNVIWENISTIINSKYLPSIDLRINYDKTNISSIPSFLEFIATKFSPSNFKISFGLITNTISGTLASSYITKNELAEDSFAKDYFSLYKKAVELGFHMEDCFYFDGMCTSKLKNSMIISSNMQIYKCLSMVGRKDYSIGTISSNRFIDKSYLFPALYEKCFAKKCPIIPICNSGCRFDAFLLNNNIQSIDCKYDRIYHTNKKIFTYLYEK